VTQLYPQAPSTYFSRILRHAWATVGLFFSLVTTWGLKTVYSPTNVQDYMNMVQQKMFLWDTVQ